MKLYTAKEMAKLLRCCERTVRAYGAKRQIGVIQPAGKGGRVMYYLIFPGDREGRS